MKKNLWKQMRVFALAGVMSLALLGCGGNDGTKGAESAEEEQQQEAPEEEKETPEAEQQEPQNQKKNTNKEADNTGTQSDEEPIGEIITIGDGQFTIKKFIQEKSEDGYSMIASPAEGAEDDESLESLTVLCDENVHIYKRTIRDGGASYEDEESSFEKLKKGMEVQLKGSYEGDTFRASEVQIVEVIL